LDLSPVCIVAVTIAMNDGSSPLCAAVKEANVPTLADHLQEYLTRPDVVKRMKPLQPACDGLLRAFSGFCTLIGAVIQRVAESPPSKGYEPWLIERSINPIVARMMAGLLVRRGNRIAKESVRLTAVVRAVRFLAKPGRNRRAISSRVDVLLAAWEETSVIETIFADAGLNEFEFMRLVKSVSEGDEGAFHRFTEIAASLAPHLPIRRGLKVCAASAAHEFFLEYTVKRMEPRAYTWNEPKGQFTDSATEATRREFARRHFDPRPAYRRLKARGIDCRGSTHESTTFEARRSPQTSKHA
jgi:hypothetical protein